MTRKKKIILSALAVIILSISGILYYFWQRNQKTEKVVAWVEKNGSVEYRSNVWVDKLPKSIQSYIGKAVVKVNLSDSDVKDLKPLLDLPELESLDLSLTEIEDMDTLVKLTNLKVLNLMYAEITTSNLMRLRESLPDCAIIIKD